LKVQPDGRAVVPSGGRRSTFDLRLSTMSREPQPFSITASRY